MKAIDVYRGSDGDVTRAYYAKLQTRGPLGAVAMNLFRAQKCSSRAKVYRGGVRGMGSFKRMAYERKSWSMAELVKILEQHGAALGIRFGWKADLSVVFGERESYVLYVDLPQGQVSFHSPSLGQGPVYPGVWDREHKSEERILAFCDVVFAEAEAAQPALFEAPAEIAW